MQEVGYGPIQRGLSTCLKCRRDVQRARTHMQPHAHARSVLHTYILYIYIYVCVYSRIVQVSRFHLCARRELKTSPSCNVTETVTKYLQPPPPLFPLSKVQMQTVTATERNSTKLAYATHKFYAANPLQKGKGKLTAVCTVEVKFRSACRGHYKCISHIAYRSH